MEEQKAITIQQNINELVKSVLDGTATSEESGLVLRSLQISISGSLVTGLSELLTRNNRLAALADRALDQLINKATVQLDSDTMSIEDLNGMISSIMNRQQSILDLYRKVAQGKELFPADVISEEERKVVKLLKSFKSQAEKKKFIQICENMLQQTDDNEFEETKNTESTKDDLED